MELLKKLTVALFVVFTFYTGLFGQGCSDAGVCTAGIMNGEAGIDGVSDKFNLSLGYNLAKGDDGTKINSLLLEASYFINSSLYLKVKLPYNIVDGNLGKTNGMGDITLLLSGMITESNGHRFDAFAGTRIASGKSDLSENGRPLPMVYQTSLGTTDLLLGAGWTYKGWGASVGYQQPLIQQNKNAFLISLWEGEANAVNYHDSKNIERKGDVVARFEKTISPGDFSFTAGLVPIYHLAEDAYENENAERVSIKGSDGLTLNLSLSAQYIVGKSLYFNAFYASPLITRDVQPAGLARSYVAGVSAGIRF